MADTYRTDASFFEKLADSLQDDTETIRQRHTDATIMALYEQAVATP